MVKAYAWYDDFSNSNLKYTDYLMTNVATGEVERGFHLWIGVDSKWTFQKVIKLHEKEPKNLVKPEFRNTLTEIDYFPIIENWMAKLIIYYIFDDFKKTIKLNREKEVTVDETFIP